MRTIWCVRPTIGLHAPSGASGSRRPLERTDAPAGPLPPPTPVSAIPASDPVNRKPRLLFFQNRYDPRLPPFLLIHVQEHVRCLNEFFDVTVIRDDCDYEEVCDMHRPDLVLVESGVNHLSCRRPRVTNTHRNSAIPKLGLHHADAFCDARAGFLSDMDRWEIQTFFAISTTAAEHTPEVADKLLYWPVFIDPHVYHDYGLPKSIPVLITGNSNSLYPWRRQVFPLVSSHFPSLVCPHPGYDPAGSFAHVLVGETYARTLNATSCIPSCGTVAKEAVRKHFEIPGCNACLITEKSPALEAAGFKDMVNCVFADSRNVVDKVDWLFRNRDVLVAITEAGHNLVHARHTYRSRGQILQWYRLHKALPDSHRIVQSNPFELPIAVDKATSKGTYHVHSNGRHLQFLREGDHHLAQRNFAAAEQAYLGCIGLMQWMPEPRLRMALCSLHRGDPGAALRWIDKITGFALHDYGAADPDPVEWAVRIVALLCFGAGGSAVSAAHQYPRLVHLELSRARWLCASLLGASAPSLPPSAEVDGRASLHVLPYRTSGEWLEDVCLMLYACGQHEHVRGLGKQRAAADRSDRTESCAPVRASPWSPAELALHAYGCSQWLRAAIKRFRGSRVRNAAASIIHGIDDRISHLIGGSGRRQGDEILAEIAKHFASDECRVVAIIGARPGSAATEVAMTALRANASNARVLCIHNGPIPRRFARRRDSRVQWRRFDGDLLRRDEFSSWMREYSIDAFDAALVDATSFGQGLGVADSLVRIARHAKTLLVATSGGRLGFLLQSALLRGSGFRLVAASEAVDGYAVLCRHSTEGAEGVTPSCVVVAPLSLGMTDSPCATGPVPFTS